MFIVSCFEIDGFYVFYSGYIVTAPAQLQLGGSERMCVTMHGTFDDDETFELDVTLKDEDDPDTVYHSQSLVFFGN